MIDRAREMTDGGAGRRCASADDGRRSRAPTLVRIARGGGDGEAFRRRGVGGRRAWRRRPRRRHGVTPLPSATASATRRPGGARRSQPTPPPSRARTARRRRRAGSSAPTGVSDRQARDAPGTTRSWPPRPADCRLSAAPAPKQWLEDDGGARRTRAAERRAPSPPQTSWRPRARQARSTCVTRRCAADAPVGATATTTRGGLSLASRPSTDSDRTLDRRGDAHRRAAAARGLVDAVVRDADVSTARAGAASAGRRCAPHGRRCRRPWWRARSDAWPVALGSRRRAADEARRKHVLVRARLRGDRWVTEGRGARSTVPASVPPCALGCLRDGNPLAAPANRGRVAARRTTAVGSVTSAGCRRLSSARVADDFDHEKGASAVRGRRSFAQPAPARDAEERISSPRAGAHDGRHDLTHHRLEVSLWVGAHRR